jgi:hypothetical protein
MKDKELQVNRSWRFVNIKPGTKVPWQQGWQTNPLELENIYSDSVGLVMGPLSGNLCAIDFDGKEAWDHYYNTFDIDILDYKTVSWTSGKDYRLQMLFKVSDEFSSVLKKKVINKMELRWTGCQSVLPPSIHPDTKQPYIWINKPSDTSVLELPNHILEYWLELVLNDYTKYDNVQHESSYYVDRNKYSFDIVYDICDKIRTNVGTLQGDYDLWRTIAWATVSELGMSEATRLLQMLWPYKTNKELKTLHAYKANTGPTIATLIKLSGLNSRQMYELECKHKYERKPRQLSTEQAVKHLHKKIRII